MFAFANFGIRKIIVFTRLSLLVAFSAHACACFSGCLCLPAHFCVCLCHVHFFIMFACANCIVWMLLSSNRISITSYFPALFSYMFLSNVEFTGFKHYNLYHGLAAWSRRSQKKLTSPKFVETSRRGKLDTPPAERRGNHHTPLKINMEHNHGGLEDHFPF